MAQVVAVCSLTGMMAVIKMEDWAPHLVAPARTTLHWSIPLVQIPLPALPSGQQSLIGDLGSFQAISSAFELVLLASMLFYLSSWVPEFQRLSFTLSVAQTMAMPRQSSL